MDLNLAKLLLRTAFLALVFATVSVQSAERPNIVFILADDLGYGDVGCYGCPDIKTPNMDRLAEEGVRCTDGYAAFPVCSPSRAALLTGRYPARFGPAYEDYFGGGSPELDPIQHPTIGQMMKDAGYRTACFGKWNVSNLNRRRANDFGFDRWVGLHLNHDYYTHKLERTGEHDLYKDGEPFDRKGVWSDTIFADEAISFIESQSAHRAEGAIARAAAHPFFIYLPFQAPHSPFQDPDVPFAPPGKKERKTLIKMVERLDLEIGRVLKTLDDQQIAENTLVIMTSDNGGAQEVARNLPLSGAKQMLQEGGIRVPLILRWPGVLPEGKEFSSPVSAMDLTATVAAAGGAKARPGKPFDGVDLLPALAGKSELAADRPLFFRRRTVVARKGLNSIRQSAVREGDWKILRTYKPRGSDRYQTALYNLKDDIGEQKDLATSHPEKMEALSKLLDQWETETGKTAAPFPPAAGRPKKQPGDDVLVGVNYFAGWWKELPNKWHGQGWNADQPDWRPEFPDRVPLLGQYNDQTTMDREIVAAADYGVDFFAILWYFPKPGSRQEKYAPLLNKGLETYLASGNAGRMRFFIEYCNSPDFSASGEEEWAACVATWVDAMKHPSYLRVDGRLVFKVHGVTQFLRANDNDLDLCRHRLDTLRDAVRNAGLGEMIIGVGISGQTPPLGAKWPPAELFDFTGTYMCVPEIEGRKADYPYAVLSEQARTTLRNRVSDPLPWMPYLAAGWNPRPWTHPGAAPHYQRFFEFPTRREFESELNEMREAFMRHPSLGLPRKDGTLQKSFTIYAWNEFGEGGIVAPTMGRGTMMLEAIRSVFGTPD